MGPTRKSRTVNKRYSYVNEVSPVKDAENAKRNNHRKRKLSDMLGPQWDKEELSRFYEAYRKYGKDWKKVATTVRNRTVDMVESLYTMNRAYLSLPEGTASVVGLIAMMTDHYANLAGSDSEQESNDGAGTSRKPQKRARGKVQPGNSKPSEPHIASPMAPSGYVGLSLTKKKRTGGTGPRVVGKRTPRFPVSYSYENIKGEKFFSPTRQGLKMKADTNDDEVAHEIALALTEASQRGGSPQASQTPNRRSESVMSSPARNAETKRAELKMGHAKNVESDMDDEDLEGSMEADTGEISGHRPYLKQSGRVGTTNKGKRIDRKKLDVDDGSNNHLDDIKEACSGTEEGQRLVAARGTLNLDAKVSRSSPQSSRKRSKKVLFGRDDVPAFDALQTLAELSVMMPEEGNEDDSLVQLNEENNDLVDESGSLGTMPIESHRDRRRSSGIRAKGDRLSLRFEVPATKVPKSGKVSVSGDNALPEMTSEGYQSKSVRKKPKTVTSKIRKPDIQLNNHVSESQEAEARDVGRISKNKRSSQSASPKLMKNAEYSSSTDPRREGSDSAQSTMQVPQLKENSLPTRVRSRRKMDLKKPSLQKDLKFPEKVLNECSSATDASLDTAFTIKEKLSNCLSNHRLRRWCTYEWFYSAIDYPWFAKREFVEYLYHVGLGHVPRLTRVEWGVIRSSLGKPRRFSQQFLKEEKKKLNQYRDSVRKHYNNLREGTQEGLPTDLARPLSVGQRVIAIHPKTREIHDGSVLTVDYSRCRVQFDRPELGVEFVMDIDCMPLNPMENIPTLLASHIAVDKYFKNFNELRMNEHAKVAPGLEMENINGLIHLSPPSFPVTNVLKQAKVAPEEANVQAKIVSTETSAYQQMPYAQPCTSAQFQAKEADVVALAELTRALDKKEAVVFELKRLNDDVVDNCSLKESESFKKQYAAVVVQLQEVDQQVTTTLFRLRQRNTYQGTVSLPSPRPVANFGDHLNSLDRSACQPPESGEHVNEIIESSRTKARTMVDVAIQAKSSLKCRENTFEKIEEAIDYVNEQLPIDDACVPPAADPKSKSASDRNEAQIPSELITSCVATLLMIQKCTERQFPPADVAQILDSAVTSLKPCCSQNLSVYAEIQKCMGIVRNKILALIPTT